MYHVLIFQQGGKYILDSAGPPSEGDSGEGSEGVRFSSLDELVLFLTGHSLKVGDDEVQLTDTCPCADDSSRLSSNGECAYYISIICIKYFGSLQTIMLSIL